MLAGLCITRRCNTNSSRSRKLPVICTFLNSQSFKSLLCILVFWRNYKGGYLLNYPKCLFFPYVLITSSLPAPSRTGPKPHVLTISEKMGKLVHWQPILGTGFMIRSLQKTRRCIEENNSYFGVCISLIIGACVPHQDWICFHHLQGKLFLKKIISNIVKGWRT